MEETYPNTFEEFYSETIEETHQDFHPIIKAHYELMKEDLKLHPLNEKLFRDLLLNFI